MGEKNKRGQVTIFIIIAMLIVGMILFFFLYLKPTFFTQTGASLYIDSCITKELSTKINQLSLTAGVVNSAFTKMYLDENITILCYTDEYHKPCVVQQPFLKQTFEENLAKIMKPIVDKCYSASLEDLKSKGYNVNEGVINQKLEIVPGSVKISVNSGTTVSNGESSAQIGDKIEINYPSEIYTILTIANSILQFETSYGDSEVSSFMFYYPDLTAEKIRRDEGFKIYILTDKKDIKYRFASRSYAWPPGYGVYQ